MNILIIHPHFPGQFVHLAPALVQAGHAVVALTMQAVSASEWEGVRLVPFALQRGGTPGVHPWLADLEGKTCVAEASLNAALGLKAEGFMPDVIVAHSGWGESLFIKDVWPEARLGICCDHFRHASGAGAEAASLRMQQLAQRLQFEQADQGMVPTRWQAESFPRPWRNRLSVVPDGVDTEALGPKADISLTLNGQLALSRQDEVLTFACRELGPQAGFHVLMRALPDILRQRPALHVLIAGGDGPAAPAPGQRSWREALAVEVQSQLTPGEWERVHFVGPLSGPQWLGLLQLSTVHVQLSDPALASAGLLEAMSVGCAIVGSRTAPLEAEIRDGDSGLLVDYPDSQALADAVCRLLDDPAERERLGMQAREFARTHHDARTICLPQQLAWVEGLAATQPPSELGAAELRSNLQEILSLL